MIALAKAASDSAREAEGKFHNGVMAMKESVRGMFGSGCLSGLSQDCDKRCSFWSQS